MELEKLLATTVESDASDLILKTGSQPAMKVHGRILFVSDTKLTDVQAGGYLKRIATPEAVHRFETDGEADFAFQHESLGRFRVNVFRSCGEISIVLRQIKKVIATFEELKLPVKQFSYFASLERGLVFMTGVTGSGKSTALASLIEAVNNTRNEHIITLEDPIEYKFEDNLSVISQREIGIDTHDFMTGLKSAMREAPDVIMIGEIRDPATMNAAISAAETGHLVLSTLHTVNAIQTVERISTFFPPHQHDLVRTQLSMVLEGVASLRLLPCLKTHRMVPAVELLLGTPRVRELIHEGKTKDLDKALVEGNEYYGTQTFNQSLKSLCSDGYVSEEDALQASDNPDDLKLMLRGVTRGSTNRRDMLRTPA
jgi:twitching motility protein PilT